MLSSASIDSSVTNVDDDIQHQQISLSEKVLTATSPFCLHPTDPLFGTHKNSVKEKPFHTHMEWGSTGQEQTDSWHPWGEVISVTLLDAFTGPDLCSQPVYRSKPMPHQPIRGNSSLMGWNIMTLPWLQLGPESLAHTPKPTDLLNMKVDATASTFNRSETLITKKTESQTYKKKNALRNHKEEM